MTTTPAAPADPFAFHIGPQTCLARAATAAARPILSKLLGLGRLRDLVVLVEAFCYDPATL